MPANLAVPEGNHVYRVLHAVGTQNYVCLPSGGGYAWGFFSPQATLFDTDGNQKLTHFLSSDPLGTARPTWMHSKDSSSRVRRALERLELRATAGLAVTVLPAACGARIAVLAFPPTITPRPRP